MYDPPLNSQQIRTRYPGKAAQLLADPIHRWRAQTGIELIHEEPDFKEQLRIWRNWQQMSAKLKRLSDRQSRKFFGMTNFEHHINIMGTKYTKNE